MKDEQIDRVLARREEIAPSSGFAASVMEAVLREASTPPPTPFPWTRALPGVLMAAMALGVAFVKALELAGNAVVTQPLSPNIVAALRYIANAARFAGIGWAVLALILTYLSAKLSAWLLSLIRN